MVSELTGNSDETLLGALDLSKSQQKKVADSFTNLYSSTMKTLLRDYSIEEVETDQDSARVSVTIKSTDFSNMDINNLNSSDLETDLTNAFLSGDKDKMVTSFCGMLDQVTAQLNSAMKSAEITENSTEIKVVKKNGKWLVSDRSLVQSISDSYLQYLQ